MGDAAASVTSLVIYPVKGCRGVRVSRALITAHGLLLDREFMVVSAASGNAVTQRQNSKLALLVPELENADGQAATELVEQPKALTLQAPSATPLRLSLARSSQAAALRTMTVTVWEWTGPAVDQGDEAAGALPAGAGSPLRLTRSLQRG